MRLAGGQALFAALARLTVEAGAVDEDFVAEHGADVEEDVGQLEDTAWADVLAATGLTREAIEALAKRYRESERVIVCWAMGLTQHRDAVATIQEFFFSSRRRHTSWTGDWSSDVCSSDLCHTSQSEKKILAIFSCITRITAPAPR